MLVQYFYDSKIISQGALMPVVITNTENMFVKLDFKNRRLLAYCLYQTTAIPFSWALLTVLLNRYKQCRIPLHALFSDHHATPSVLHTCPIATPMTLHFWKNQIRNCLHVLQHSHTFCPLFPCWTTAHLQSFPPSPLFIRHTHDQT